MKKNMAFVFIICSIFFGYSTNMANTNIKSHIEKAQHYIDEGDAEKAINELEKAVEKNPADFDAYLDLGSMYFLTQKYNKAKDCFQSAAFINPKNPMPWNNLGLIYLQSEQYEKALESFSKSIELDAEFGDANLNMSRLMFLLKNYDNAIRFAEIAAKTPEKRFKAYYEIAKNYKAKNLFDLAVDYYKKSIAENPENLKAHIDLAYTFLYDLKDYNSALDEFMGVLKKDESVASAHFGLGVVFMENGNLSAAENAFKTAINYEPKLVDAYLRLGLINRERNDEDTAKQFFLTALEIKPDYAPALYNIGLSYEKENQPDKALKYYEKAVQSNPLDYMAFNNLGLIYKHKGEDEKSIQCLKRALALTQSGSNSEPIKINLAGVLKKNNQKEAKQLLMEVKKNSKNKQIVAAAADMLDDLK